MANEFDTATGTLVRLVPSGPELDKLLVVVRMGTIFMKQHTGRKPGALAQLVLECAARVGPRCSFKQLIFELEREAARRALHGEQASPVENVDHGWYLVTIHTARGGRVQVPFGTVKNHLTAAKKILAARFTSTAKP